MFANVIDVRFLPPPPQRRAMSRAVWRMLVLLVTEAMLFAGLISLFVGERSGAGAWPPADQPRLPVEQTALNAVVLVLSGVALHYALRRYESTDFRALRPLIMAILLGGLFVAFQGVEWAALLRQGLHAEPRVHTSFFYLVVGGYALHAVAALGLLVFSAVRLWQDKLRPEIFAGFALFWYFVVAMWPVILLEVYG